MYIGRSSSPEKVEVNFGRTRSGEMLKSGSRTDQGIAISALRRFLHTGTNPEDVKIAQSLRRRLTARELGAEQLRVFGLALKGYADGTGKDVARIADSGQDLIEWDLQARRIDVGETAKRLHDDVDAFFEENPDFAPQPVQGNGEV